MTKILIAIEGLNENVSNTDVINAVRRAFSGKEVALQVGTVAESKGVTYRVRKDPKVTIPVETFAGVVRTWANDNGFAVGLRGRIPAEVTAAYTAATTAKPKRGKK